MRVTVQMKESGKIRMWRKLLSLEKKMEMYEAAGTELQKITVDHIRALGQSSYYATAAKKVSSPSALHADSSSAVLTINHPGFRRAFSDIRIVPRTAKALAIPIHPIAKGFYAKELWERLELFVLKKNKSSDVGAIATKMGGVVTPIYILCKSVNQKQDRSMLPSDEQFQAAAEMGAKNYLRSVFLK